MRKTFLTITALALVPFGTAACVSKSEYTKAVESAEVRYNALEAQNARLKGDLADAGKRNEQLTADQAQLERTLALKSGELGKTIVDLRQRVGALENDNTRLAREVAESNKAREEKVREAARPTSSKVIEIVKTVSDKSIRPPLSASSSRLPTTRPWKAAPRCGGAGRGAQGHAASRTRILVTRGIDWSWADETPMPGWSSVIRRSGGSRQHGETGATGGSRA